MAFGIDFIALREAFSRRLIVGAAAALLLAVALALFHLRMVSSLAAEIAKRQVEWEAVRPEISRLETYRRAQEDLNTFSAALPSRREFPAVSAWLTQTAQQRKLVLPSVAFAVERPGPSISEITFSFTVHGGYRTIREFIHDIEDSPHLLMIEELTLGRAGKGGEPIDLVMKVKGFFREGPG